MLYVQTIPLSHAISIILIWPSTCHLIIKYRRASKSSQICSYPTINNLFSNISFARFSQMLTYWYMLRLSNPTRLDLEKNLRLWMDTNYLVEFSNKIIFSNACSRVSPQTSCTGRNLEQTSGRCN